MCLECEKRFIGFKELHVHLRSHKINSQDYYHKHFPRKDLYNKEFIDFKNRDQYFTSFFNSPDNFHYFFESHSKVSQQNFIREFLVSRKNFKETQFAPCQVELRTIKQAPNIVHFRNAFLSKNYYRYCKDLGFKTQFEDFDGVKLYQETLNDLQICIDTREQKPFKFSDIPTVNEKLDYGDYKFYNHNGYEIYFERKSLTDLISTVTMGLERFENEIARAKDNEHNIIVIVEASIKDLLNFNKLKWVFSSHGITPDYVCHNIRGLIQKHQNLQFLFTGSRSEAVRVMSQIFCTANRYKTMDLQLDFDLGLL